MARNLNLVASLILIGLVVIFVVQNTEVLNVEFLIWSFEVRRAFLIFIVLGIGIVVGWVLRRSPQQSGPKGDSDPADRGTSS